jgi:hypothetical protein
LGLWVGLEADLDGLLLLHWDGGFRRLLHVIISRIFARINVKMGVVVIINNMLDRFYILFL